MCDIKYKIRLLKKTLHFVWDYAESGHMQNQTFECVFYKDSDNSIF